MPRRIFGPQDDTLPAAPNAAPTAPPPGPTPEEILQQVLGLQEERARQAHEAESRALMQLQEAQAAPVPGLNPLAAALSMGLGRVGTTLAQAGPGPHPDYAAKTFGVLQEQQTTQASERKTNLEALRKTYEQAAKEAAAAGDTAAEIKTRTAIHKLDKEAAKQAAADKVQADKEAADAKAARDREAADVEFGRKQTLQAGAAQNARDLENLRAQHDRDLAAVKDAATKGSPEEQNTVFGSLVQHTESGIPWIESSRDLTIKERSALTRWASEQDNPASGTKGIPIINSANADVVRSIQAARSNITNQFEALEATGLPRNAVQRATQSPGIKLSELTQSRPDRKAFNDWSLDAINVIRANAGGNGLRMTQAEINLAMGLLPKLTDTYATAAIKVAVIKKMMDNRERSVLMRDFRPGKAGATVPFGTLRLTFRDKTQRDVPLRLVQEAIEKDGARP